MLNILLSLISGILFALSFPKANLFFLAWFALSPFIYLVYKSNLRQSIIYGFSFGFGFFGLLLYWIAIFGKLPWIALAIYQSIFVMIFAMMLKVVLCRFNLTFRLLLVPSLWVILEWFRSLGMLGFTWGDAGYSQYKVIPVIQIASITGVWGISFIILLSNTAIANLVSSLRSPSHSLIAFIQTIAVGLIMLLIVTYGYIRSESTDKTSGKRIRAAIVQGNIDQDTYEDSWFYERSWDTYTNLTKRLSKEADIIVWPETVIPGYVRKPYVKSRLFDLASESGAFLLVGGWDRDNKNHVYNSAFLISPQKMICGSYSKVHLVPFGEFVPSRKYMPFLKYYRVTPHDTSPGRGYNLMDTGKYKIGTAICFESIFPDISRKFSAAGAQLLCVITNDCWYDTTAAAEQHMAMSVFRAVENQRYLLRGASTGISCIISPSGKIIVNSTIQDAISVKADIKIVDRLTFYTKHGNWIIYLSLIIILSALIFSIVKLQNK